MPVGEYLPAENTYHYMNCTGKAILVFAVMAAPLLSSASELNVPNPEAGSNAGWQELEKGLELGILTSPQRSEKGDSMIRALRIDPQRFDFRLLNASAEANGYAVSPKQWCRRYGLVAAINASMYQTDFKSSVSLMRTKNHINNPRLSADMMILAFDRLSPEVPLIKLIDRQCEDFETLKNKYGTLIQSIRMISCKGKNVWGRQIQQWSTAAIGIDHQGKVLFIHVRAPYNTHDLINILKKLPLDIERAMYVEGGPEAQLYIRSGGQEYEFVGSYENNFTENMENSFSLPIPNVVGIYSRKESAD
jgi:uncharacterized protein YigE (DUF2233 family)